MSFATEPVTPAHWPALADLFEPAGASNGCWCAYWRIGPRYRDRPRRANRDALRRRVAAGHSTGLLASDDGLVVGWCELAPRAELGWLAHARHLQPVDDLPVWSVPCFFVRREHRGRGVTAALLEAAVGAARREGAVGLEGYPVDTAVAGHTTNLFPGVASTFARAGFAVVARRRPDRPIVRLML